MRHRQNTQGPLAAGNSRSRRVLLQHAGRVGLTAGLLTLAGPLRHISAQPALTQASPPPDGSAPIRFRLGALTMTLVSDGVGTFPNPPHLLFANAPEDELARSLKEHQAPEPWTEWVSPFTPLLIEAGAQRILVDTGIGASIGPTAGKLTARLAAVDVDPEEITMVLLSHGHPDHIGGLTDLSGRRAFPNARHLMSRTEWALWSDPTRIKAHVPASDFRDLMLMVAATNLPAICSDIELFDAGDEVAPGIVAIAAPGHSPGHTVFSINSEDQRLYYGADTVLHPIHLEHPDWLTVFDTTPEPTVTTRHRVLSQIAAEGVLMTAYHIPSSGVGHVISDGDAWRWESATPR